MVGKWDSFVKMTSEIPDEIHLRHCMLYEFKKGVKAATATKNICQVYPNGLDVRKCQRWFSKFRSGDFNLFDSSRSGRPSILNNEILTAEVETNPRLTIGELSSTLEQAWSTVREHLQKIGKTNKAGVWVPQNLSKDEKANRFKICTSLLQRHNKESFFDRLITGAEKWFFYGDLPHKKKKKRTIESIKFEQNTVQSISQMKKSLLCVWWNMYGIVHLEILEPEQTMNAGLYCEQLDRLNQSLFEKYPEIVYRKGVILQHDNIEPHRSQQVIEKIHQLGWELLEHPPDSPDITPSDYHLFRSILQHLNKSKYETLVDIKNAIENYFAQKPLDFYRTGIEGLLIRWKMVLNKKGDYINDN